VSQTEKQLKKLNKREAYNIISLFSTLPGASKLYSFFINILRFAPLIFAILLFVLHWNFCIFLLVISFIVNTIIHYQNKNIQLPFLHSMPQLLILVKCSQNFSSDPKFDSISKDISGIVDSLESISKVSTLFKVERALDSDMAQFAWLIMELLKISTLSGYRSFLNLASPLFFKPLNIIKKEDLKLSLSAGYTMSPFGDFVDENCWIKYHQKYNIHAYLRQFENRNNWFMGGGISLVDYQIAPKFNATIAGHFWNQPKNLDFNTSDSKFGGSGDLLFRYIVLGGQSSNSMSVDLGINYKTVGFLPEEVYLKENVGVRLGVTVNLIKSSSKIKNK